MSSFDGRFATYCYKGPDERNEQRNFKKKIVKFLQLVDAKKERVVGSFDS